MEEEMTSRNESASKDFLKRFAGNSFADKHPEGTGGDYDEIELSLGLSLGGCFSGDPKGKKLVRSSSIASFSSFPTEPEFPVATGLSRTSSLPTEIEEERRKRKELQSLKRLEARRKRSEKRNSLKRGPRADDDWEGGQSSAAPTAMKVGNFEVGLNGGHGFPGGGHLGKVVNAATPPGLPGWLASSGQATSWPMSQGSIGSQGSSSGMSEYESRPKQGFDISGFTSCTEVRSPSTFQSLPEHAYHKMAANAATSAVGKAIGSVGGGEEDPAKKNAGRANVMKEMERNMIEEMPCVFTKGDGPNGRRIEGFLYKYKKGGEVRIVCVCHGSFLTPAEFVRHAGGFVVVFMLWIVSGCAGRPLHDYSSQKPKQPLRTFRPYNIAHRGSNGELPEETAAAYMRAIEECADFIESDILATKDGELICMHDVTLDATTDVAEHKEFADRKRTYEVQWANVTGWFPVDFTLEEIKTLRAKQRFPFRDQQYNGKFQIITFDEFISIALNAPRVVGIYPEIKNPVFINKHVKWEDGKKFEDKFVQMLKKYGYKGEYMSED